MSKDFTTGLTCLTMDWTRRVESKISEDNNYYAPLIEAGMQITL